VVATAMTFEAVVGVAQTADRRGAAIEIGPGRRECQVFCVQGGMVLRVDGSVHAHRHSTSSVV